MKNQFLILMLAAVFAVACGTDATDNFVENESTGKIEILKTATKDDKPMANICVEGMSCVEGCGGVIKKGLMKIDGVQAVNFDFDPEKSTDIAHVEFDPAKCNAEDMAKQFDDIVDGMYKVKSIELVNVQ